MSFYFVSFLVRKGSFKKVQTVLLVLEKLLLGMIYYSNIAFAGNKRKKGKQCYECT